MFKKRSIPELFAAREEAFDKATDKIFAALDGVFAALREHMEIEEIEKIGGVLEWEDIMLVEDDKQPFLVIVGVISHPPGTEFEMPDGTKVQLTKETAPYFRRLVRAGVPISIVDKSKQEIIDYLIQIEAEQKQHWEEESKKILAEDGKSLSELLEEHTNSKKQETEFDLSQLTDEQRKALELSLGTKSGKA